MQQLRLLVRVQVRVLVPSRQVLGWNALTSRADTVSAANIGTRSSKRANWDGPDERSHTRIRYAHSRSVVYANMVKSERSRTNTCDLTDAGLNQSMLWMADAQCAA